MHMFKRRGFQLHGFEKNNQLFNGCIIVDPSQPPKDPTKSHLNLKLENVNPLS